MFATHHSKLLRNEPIYIRLARLEYAFGEISNIPEAVTRIDKMRHLFAWFHITKGK